MNTTSTVDTTNINIPILIPKQEYFSNTRITSRYNPYYAIYDINDRCKGVFNTPEELSKYLNVNKLYNKNNYKLPNFAHFIEYLNNPNYKEFNYIYKTLIQDEDEENSITPQYKYTYSTRIRIDKYGNVVWKYWEETLEQPL